MAMTNKERDDYERMRVALKRIATRYLTPAQLGRNAEKLLGLSYTEALEMAYENIQDDARMAVRGVRRAKLDKS